MRTFQYSDAKSHKFWIIEVHGASFTVTFGKIGTSGRFQTKSFTSAEKAQLVEGGIIGGEDAVAEVHLCLRLLPEGVEA